MSNLDLQIKRLSKELKELIAEKKGITVKELEKQQSKRVFIQKKKIDTSRFRNITFQFQCPNCKGFNTKRNGTTTQINTKARILCHDCQLKRQEIGDIKITAFFVLDNEQMKKAINNNKNITEAQKKMFYEKYLIKM